MTRKEMDVFTAHCDKYFKQNDCMVLHSDGMKPHIDVLRYPPSKAVPCWKLVTMGASDHAMPKQKGSFGNRNEYVIFVDAEEPLWEDEACRWYVETLWAIALYPMQSRQHITYGHSMEWPEESESDMVGAYLELPQLVEDVGFLRCKLSFLKEAVILQPVLLTRQETDRLLEEGPEAFSNWLYPENGDRPHFLSQRRRTELF